MTGPEGWAGAAVAFLRAHLPRGPDGWDPAFISAQQMGTAALAALGQAREVDGGAAPVDDPRLPSVLPRWDDICVCCVGLAR